MSVFTTLTLSEVRNFLKHFPIDEVVDLKGIAAGITNTNYFVYTQNSRYVLTLFEENKIEELPYFVALMSHLAKHNVPCPMPIADLNGVALHELKGKPALMVSCLSGQDTESPTLDQCALVGRTLAQLHLVGQNFKHQSKNIRGIAWRISTAQKVFSKLDDDDKHLLNQIMAFQADFDISALPQGVIHGDLFRDNVLFDGEKLGGFIDFYYACDDALALDVAIAVNDWCLKSTGEFDEPRLNAFMQAYTEVRPFNEEEQRAWQGLLCVAALRFWLSRLHDWHFPIAGELTHAKDPNYFKQILLRRGMPKNLSNNSLVH